MFKIDAIIDDSFYYKVPLKMFKSLQARTEAIRNGLDILFTEDEDKEILSAVYEDVVKLGEDLGCWERW